MAYIDNLPAIDIWPLIFRKLSIDDLFNCRLVNKKFKYFSDHTDGVYRLIVGEYDVQKYWSYNKEATENEDLITFKCYQQIRSLNLFNLNKNLKYLIIKVDDKKYDLDELSSFINLENLEIEIPKLNKDKNLNLQNLTFFDFKTSGLNYKINLNTPKLTKIKYIYNLYNPRFTNYIDFTIVKILNPESIKHLIIDDYNHKFEIFKNLEILDLYSLNRIHSDVLNSFTKLRKIKFKFYSNIDTIKNLLNYMRELQRDIRIYFKDVKIKNVNTINEYKYFKNILDYQIKNYNQLDSNLSTIRTHLEYDQLERWFNNLQIHLPASFFDKYVLLKSIYVCNHVNNNDDLNWFLKNLKNLRELYILDTSLDQNVYDNLPNTIRMLKIVSSKNIENHDFIFKLTKLTYFSTKTDHIDLFDLFDLGLKSFLNLKYLAQFRFYFNNKPILITKFRNKFDLIIDDKIEKKRINYEQLVNSFSIFV